MSDELQQLRDENAVLTRANAKLLVALGRAERNIFALKGTVAELQAALLKRDQPGVTTVPVITLTRN